jgi:hypothetical protein
VRDEAALPGKNAQVSLTQRLREIASALRGARFPAPPAQKPKDAGGYTGEGPLVRSLMRDAERNRARAESAARRKRD